MRHTSVLDTLIEHALSLESDRSATLTELVLPADKTPQPPFHQQFVVAQLDGGTPGLAYARLTAPTDTPTLTLPCRASDVLEAALGRTATPAPIALATLNALCTVHHAAQLQNAELAPDTVVSFDQPQRIGMVGYFAPLIPVLLAAGHTLQCVELDSQHWQSGPELVVGSDVGLLKDCDTVLCTATVLLNNSFNAVRDAAAACSRFVLLGPSAPVAPTWLVHHGVTHVAGRRANDTAAFWAACRSGNDWSSHMDKFLLDIKKAPLHDGKSA